MGGEGDFLELIFFWNSVVEDGDGEKWRSCSLGGGIRD